jgi:hypothetical protein
MRSCYERNALPLHPWKDCVQTLPVAGGSVAGPVLGVEIMELLETLLALRFGLASSGEQCFFFFNLTFICLVQTDGYKM